MVRKNPFQKIGEQNVLDKCEKLNYELIEPYVHLNQKSRIKLK